MSISLNANFELLSAGLYLDARQQFNTLIEMKDFAETSIPDGFITYNKETQKHYVFSSSNTVDATLGKWREYNSGGGSSEKQIKDWVSGSSYLEGDYIYHEGELYRCLATNNNVDFNETNWEQLTYGIDELTKEDVERLLGLTKEEIEDMTDLILDTEVRIDKTYSSSKIYTDIQQCLEDSKTYTLEELSKVSGVSYKIVTSTSEMTSESIIYLLANGSTYDMYIVEENGATTKIGDMNINLSQYYTKTEIDNDFLKKVDADGKYATITSVDGKVDKRDIVDNLTSINADKPLSAKQGKVLNDGLGLKANDNEVIKKTDISTSINSTSTDSQVPSAKSVYTNILSLLRNQGITEEQVNSNIETFYIGTVSSDVGQAIGLPLTNGILGKIINIPHGAYTIQLAWDVGKHNNIFMLRKCSNGVWQPWQKVCTTTDLTEINDKLTQLENNINKVDDKVFETITNPTELDTNKYIKNGFYSIGEATKRTNLPTQKVGTLLVYYAGYYVIQEYILNENLRRFMRRSLDKGKTWSYWKELATMDKLNHSTVADVPKTLTPLFPSVVKVASGGVSITYIVRNGWCNVNFKFNITSSTTFSWTDIAWGLPIPANSINTVLMSDGKATQPIPIKITSTGSVSSKVISAISTTDWWTGNISYPVAE